MKKNIFLVFTLLFLLFGYSQSNAVYEGNCLEFDGFDLYECKVKKMCKKYLPKKPLLTKYKKYKSAEDFIKKYKKIARYEGNKAMIPIKISAENYRENMGGIYACALVKVQYNSIQKAIRSLIKMDKTSSLKIRIETKLKQRLEKLKFEYKSRGCYTGDKKTIYNKKNVLDDTTYEMCRYTNYLEYLKEYYKDPKNLLDLENEDGKSKKLNSDAFIETKNEFYGELDKEMKNTFKVYKLAFNSYSQYENNYPIHLWLEILRVDFIVFREKFYQAIQPINQLLYKISNAMKD